MRPLHCFGGYDSTNKIAFVAHFSNADQVRKFGGLIFFSLYQLAKEKIDGSIQLHLRGGIRGESEGIIEAIEVWMNQNENFPMNISSRDLFLDNQSLSIDARTGLVSEYDPKANPHSSGISKEAALAILSNSLSDQLNLVYRPTNF